MKKFVVGITGASGAVYGVRLVQELQKQGHFVHLLLTEASFQVFREELGWDTSDRQQLINEKLKVQEDLLAIHSLRDFKAPIASGSYICDGMIIIPCSMGTLAKIANGISSNVLERAADVTLKEGRKLIVVPRETPFNLNHLENMKRLMLAGGTIIPAMPGFYHRPQTIDDIVQFLVGKVMDSLGIKNDLYTRWGGER
ncbi:UbiX family flavin prenyltransferase [Massilibacterium senegalense]|uniref:UbiX family flavin prenyltransferase n=1 Tax=Massilibacterium senegalense TaxID=1632858 RepID=UPI000780F90F|nr:flavin prenyltransferase UbiX [Massilibacterium senegalense]